MNSLRSKFTVKKVIEAKPATKDKNSEIGKVFIVDNDQGMSVTNDAEAVVAYLHEVYPYYRIIYRDTGVWSELNHTGGMFTGFSPYMGGQEPKA